MNDATEAILYGDRFYGPSRASGEPHFRRLAASERIRVCLPHSEACCHLGLAGSIREVELTEAAVPMVQIYDPDGRRVSFPVTPGEAGIYQDGTGFYAYQVSAGVAVPTP